MGFHRYYIAPHGNNVHLRTNPLNYVRESRERIARYYADISRPRDPDAAAMNERARQKREQKLLAYLNG